MLIYVRGCRRDRHLSISIHVEVFDATSRADTGAGCCLLFAADRTAVDGGPSGSHRSLAEGPGRPGAAAAALAGGGARRWGSLRVRPQRRLRPVPADHQPSPEGAPRGRSPRPQQTRCVGLLPRQRRGDERRRPAAGSHGPVSDTLGPRALAELLGTAFLLAAVVGSGIAASRLSPDDRGLELLENSIATGAALAALILALHPVSAAFNPVVTLAEVLLDGLAPGDAAVLIGSQVAGAAVGAVVANLMFGLDPVSWSSTTRGGGGHGLGEVVATLGLVLVVFGAARTGRIEPLALGVGGYIAAAYWFTSSTSFANPAVTLARTLSDTFAGIDPSSVPGFVLAQLAGGGLGIAAVAYLFPRRTPLDVTE